MHKLLLYLSIFIMFWQPTAIFPGLTEYSPLRNSLILALIAYLTSSKKNVIGVYNINEGKYLAVFIIAQILSATIVWPIAGVYSIEVWLLYIIVFYLIVKQADDIRTIRAICVMITVAVFYLSYYSLKTFVMTYEAGTRAGGFGWYINANDLAMILACAIPLSLLVSETINSLFCRYLFIAVAGMFSFNILFTASRNGLLSLATVAGLGVLCSNKMSGLVKIVAAIALITGIVTIGVTNVLSRGDKISGLRGDDSAENRIVQWKAGVKMILDNPLFGVGPDGFEDMARNYGGEHGMAPHNTLIQVFAETGIPGGFCFVMFACYPLVRGAKLFWKRRNEEPTQYLIVYRYLVVCLGGFWVGAIFSNRDKSYIIYVIIALITAVQHHLLKNDEGDMALINDTNGKAPPQ